MLQTQGMIYISIYKWWGFPNKACFGDPFHLSKSSAMTMADGTRNGSWQAGEAGKSGGKAAAHSTHLSNNCPHIMATTKRDGDSDSQWREPLPHFLFFIFHFPHLAGDSRRNCGKWKILSSLSHVSVPNKNVRTLQRTHTQTHTVWKRNPLHKWWWHDENF